MADARKIVRAAETIKWEHDIVVVTDGGDALKYVRGQAPFTAAARPSMILLDLNLPGLSGFEVLAAIKSDQATRRIPVVVISSSGEVSDVSRAYEAHANAYLRKPIGLDALNQLARALQQFWFRMVTLPGRGESHGHRS
jgi:two-component system, chemotaxis family, response regulator Rcp1